jgi:hypothetical protein
MTDRADINFAMPELTGTVWCRTCGALLPATEEAVIAHLQFHAAVAAVVPRTGG